MSSSDDELPVLMPLPKKRGRRKKEYTFDDLKKFADKADHSQQQLANYQALVSRPLPKTENESDSDDMPDETKHLMEQGREMADKAMALFSSSLTGTYPGLGIIPAEAPLSPNLKTSVEMVGDDGPGLLVDGLFNAVGFASSKQELIEAETALRRVLASMFFKWIPKMDQFLGILSTAFGADVACLFPATQVDGFKNRTSIYNQINFYASRPVRRRESGPFGGQPKSKSLDNLDALVGILSRLDWQTANGLAGQEKAAWIHVLLSLSLDMECRDRFEFQSSIAKCIREMAEVAVASPTEWKLFANNIQTAIVGDPTEPRHHHNMVQLISQLPIGTAEFTELRSSISVECIAAILGNQGIKFRGGVVSALAGLFEQAKESRLLKEAYPLNSLLGLVQSALTQSDARSASADDVNRLVDIFEAIKSRRFMSNYESARDENNGISFLDGKRISFMISVIVDGQLRPQRPQLELFRMIDTGNSGDDTFDLEDMEDGGKEGGGGVKKEEGGEN